MSVQKPFDLPLAFAYTMSFVLLNLGQANASVRQPDLADTFELAPATPTKTGFQVGVFADRKVDGDGLDI